MKNIAVIFGGTSTEHDVSVITGTMTVNSITGEKHVGIPIYVDKDGAWYYGEILKDVGFYKSVDYGKIERVTLVSGENTLYRKRGKKLKPLFSLSGAINCLHGECGEDGTMEGVLSMSNVASCSPPMLCSAVCMDKSFTKIVAKGLNVKTLKSVTVKSEKESGKIEKILGYPVIVKPCCTGSSIGIKKAENESELKDAISFALRYGEKVLIEPFISEFTEINCAAFRGKDNALYVSECEKPFRKNDILTFEDKYKSGEREFPAKIDKCLSYKIKSLTEKLYQKLCVSGVIRIDYMVIDDEVYLNEINTVPGSLAYYLFCDDVKEFGVMLEEIIDESMQRFIKGQARIKTFKSNILYSFGTKGAKHL